MNGCCPPRWLRRSCMVCSSRIVDCAPMLMEPTAALDVGGMEAKHIWGKQWIKLLELLYEAATVGIGGKSETVLGGRTPEGKAACVRVQLEIENIMRS